MPDLPKRQLGRTGLDVTTIGYGAWEIGKSQREVEDAVAERILNAVLDAGVNFIDTALDYGPSQARIGKFVSHRRDEYYIASKAGCLERPPGGHGGGPPPHLYTRENILWGIDRTLRELNTDYLDILKFHGSPSKQEMEEHGALDTVLELKEQGKVRWIGISGTMPNLPEQIEMGVFDVFQIPYSALQRDLEDVITQAANTGAGIVIRGGAAQGGPDKQQGSSWDKWQQSGLDEILGGMSRMEFVLRFTISHPDMATTIVGTVNPDHLASNIEALQKGPLPADLYEEAKRRLTETAASVPV